MTARLFAGSVLVAVGMLTTAGPAISTEKLAYRAIERDGQFELGLTEPQVVAQTFVEDKFEQVGDEGFRRPVAYIGDANHTRATISPTAPVVQEPASEAIAMTAPGCAIKKSHVVGTFEFERDRVEQLMNRTR